MQVVISQLKKLEIRDMEKLTEIWSSDIEEVRLSELRVIRVERCDSVVKTLEIDNCDRLEYVFTFSTLESLIQLQNLYIYDCKAMKVIVKEEHGDEATMTSAAKIVVFPCLKFIRLIDLPNLMGFFLGTNEFHYPSLDDVGIYSCPHMTVFTSGHLKAPKLKYIHTSLGKHSLECGGINNFLVQVCFSYKKIIPCKGNKQVDTTTFV